MAQERCVKRSVSRGRLWSPGDVRRAPEDSNGKPFASDYFRLVQPDEVVSERELFDPEKAEEARKEVGLRDKNAAILRALNRLDPDNDRHWTRAGLPDLATLHTLTDLDVSRGDVRSTWPEFERSTAKELLKNDS